MGESTGVTVTWRGGYAAGFAGPFIAASRATVTMPA
jgi:hypothetical protein